MMICLIYVLRPNGYSDTTDHFGLTGKYLTKRFSFWKSIKGKNTFIEFESCPPPKEKNKLLHTLF